MQVGSLLAVSMSLLVVSGCFGSQTFHSPEGELVAGTAAALAPPPERPDADAESTDEGGEDAPPLLFSAPPLGRTDSAFANVWPHANRPLPLLQFGHVEHRWGGLVWSFLGPSDGNPPSEGFARYHWIADEPGREVFPNPHEKILHEHHDPASYAYGGDTWTVTYRQRDCDYGEGTLVISERTHEQGSKFFSFCMPHRDWFDPLPFLSPDKATLLVMMRRPDGMVGFAAVDLAQKGVQWSLIYHSQWGTDWDTFLLFFDKVQVAGHKFDQIFLLSYASKTGRVALDGFSMSADRSRAEVTGLWTSTWTPGWKHFTRINAPGRGLSYIAWNAETDKVVVDRFNPETYQFETVAETTWEGPNVPLVGYSFPEFRSGDQGVGAFLAQSGNFNQEIIVARFRLP